MKVRFAARGEDRNRAGCARKYGRMVVVCCVTGVHCFVSATRGHCGGYSTKSGGRHNVEPVRQNNILSLSHELSDTTRRTLSSLAGGRGACATVAGTVATLGGEVAPAEAGAGAGAAAGTCARSSFIGGGIGRAGGGDCARRGDFSSVLQAAAATGAAAACGGIM